MTTTIEVQTDGVLYVSTTLDTREVAAPLTPEEQEAYEARGLRQLDPQYYAWLCARMARAAQRQQVGRLPSAQYQDLCTRFEPIQAWAEARFGEEALTLAATSFVPHSYQPPVALAPPASPPPHLYPSAEARPCLHPVSPEAVAKVDAIREQALALGWTEAALYQNQGRYRFPCGQEYGLVCFLEGGEEVGEVTAAFIETVRPNGRRLRFHRPRPGTFRSLAQG